MTQQSAPFVPLTTLAATAGCAAKIAQVDLLAALAHLPRDADPRVLVGLETSDDAAVIQLTPELGLVQTVDIFTPIVDDPYDYGRIAAANALSDLYAMGAAPLSALSFVAWPMDTAGPAALGELFRGASAVCSEAGVVISGGHSIVDKEPKFGLFVTGTVPLRTMWTNTGARPGDRLLLTKPIGTGIFTTARKRGYISAQQLQPAIDNMTTLNAAAATALQTMGDAVHAVTDVTGFGLLGHLGNVLRASSNAADTTVGAQLWLDAVPTLPGVYDLLERGACPGGSKRNLAFAAPQCRFDDDVNDDAQLLLADAQTSGGLLVAVSADHVEATAEALSKQGVGTHAVIGEVITADDAGVIQVSLTSA